MKIILQLSIFSVGLILLPNNSYSIDEIRIRLGRGRPSNTAEIIQEKPSVISSSEERKSDVSTTSEATTNEGRGSMSSVEIAGVTSEEDLLSAVSKGYSSLKKVPVANVDRNVDTSHVAPFGQGSLKKTTSRLTDVDAEGNSSITLTSRKPNEPSHKDTSIDPLSEHHETFKYVGGTRIVENKK